MTSKNQTPETVLCPLCDSGVYPNSRGSDPASRITCILCGGRAPRHIPAAMAVEFRFVVGRRQPDWGRAASHAHPDGRIGDGLFVVQTCAALRRAYAVKAERDGEADL